MLDEKILIKHRFRAPKFIQWSITIFMLLIFGGNALPATFALQQKAKKPSIADEVGGSDSAGANPAPSAPAKPTRTRTQRTRTTSGRARLPQLDVTFVTDVPNVDIFLIKQGYYPKIGQTGPDGKLSVKLPQGAHTINASRNGYAAKRQQIEVRSDRTFFTISLKGENLVSSSSNAMTDSMWLTYFPPTPKQSERASAARESGGGPTSAKGVFELYLDPKQTDKVTAADWQRVQADNAEILSQDPSNVQAKAQKLFADGQLAYLQANYADAVTAFNSAALVKPDSALAFYGLGNAYLANNQTQEAGRAYLRAAQLNSKFALAYKGLGDVFTRQDRRKEALYYYNQAMMLGLPLSHTGLGTARNMIKEHRYTDALKLLTDLAKTDPSSDIYLAIGDCYVGLKQLLSASQAYRKATEVDSKSAAAYAKYGDTMYDLHEYGAAKEALERALALDPTGQNIDAKRTRKQADEAAKRANKLK